MTYDTGVPGTAMYTYCIIYDTVHDTSVTVALDGESTRQIVLRVPGRVLAVLYSTCTPQYYAYWRTRQHEIDPGVAASA